MTKQEFLLAILDKLQDDRLPAIGIKTLLQANVLGEDIIDTIIDIFQQAATETKSETLKTKLAQGVTALEHIKDLEDQERLHDVEELTRLEHIIDQM